MRWLSQLLVGFAVTLGLLAFTAWTVTIVWSQMLAGQGLDLPPMSFANALGIAILVGRLSHQGGKPEGEELANLVARTTATVLVLNTACLVCSSVYWWLL